MAPKDMNVAAEPHSADGPYTLELLHIADQEASSQAVFDAPRLSAVVNALEAQDIGAQGVPDNAIRLSSGDAILPGLFFQASETIFGQPGVADLLIQNELGFEAIAFGNHEFDQGPGLIADLIDGTFDTDGDPATEDTLLDYDVEGVPQYQGTDFPYISGNLDYSTQPDLAPLEVPPAEPPVPQTVTSSVVLEEGGELIGVVGATTPTLPSISSPGELEVLPEDFDSTPSPAQLDALAAVIQGDVNTLLAENPGLNKVVLLAHMQQIGIEQALAERLTGVDIIVAGGSNTRLLDETDRLREGDTVQGEYPIEITNAEGGTTLVVNTDGSYKYVGRLVIDFDAQGNIIPGSYDPDVSGAYATDEEGVAALDAEGLVDPEIARIAEEVGDLIAEQESNFFGLTEVFLDGRREEVRTEETNLGNLTADANLAIARQVDEDVVVSIKNGGGIREAIGEAIVQPGTNELELLPPEPVLDAEGNVIKPAGGISQNDIANALRFNNELALVSLNTEQLAAVLEHAFAASEFQNGEPVTTPGQFPQIAGLEVSFDPTDPAGNRIQNAGIFAEDGTLVAEIIRDGEVVDNGDQRFRVVTLDFLAEGGDGYPFPDLSDPEVNYLNLTEAGLPEGDATFADAGTEQDALAEYLEDNFLDEPFKTPEAPIEEDARIQNLALRDDAVFDEVPGEGDGDGNGDGDGDGNGGEQPEPEITPIYDIQGASQVAPSVLAASGFSTVPQLFDALPEDAPQLTGGTVTTRGIVTAVDANGFYLQDPAGDRDLATSDAIFVFTGDEPTVAVGDEARVSGEVAEFFPGGTASRNLPTTEIVNTTEIAVLSSGNALPAAQIIGSGGRIPPGENIEDDAFVAFNPDEAGIDFFESLEGMRVTVEDALAVAPTNDFGEIFTVANNGANTDLSERGTANIAPEDFNPERIQIDADGDVSGFDLPEVTVGAELGDVTGVVGYAFGNFEVIPTEPLGEVVPSSLEREVSDITGGPGQVTVASYNVLNLDPNDDDGDEDVADFRFVSIADQIVDNLNTPDIIGLQEIQDSTGSADDGVVSADETLALLSRAIDFADDGLVNGSLEYEYIDNTFITEGASGGQPGGNIRTAFLYNPDRVSLVEGSVQPIGGQEEGDAFFDGRLPLVATFAADGEEVTVVNNHFSSKGGSAPILGIEQPFEELQENPEVNGSLDERRAQAAAVEEFVSERLAENPDANLIVLGDLNEFEFVSPVEGLETTGLRNLVNTVEPDERYSFIFQGNSQVLDHILVSEALADGAEFDFVHVNSEFPADDFRASDHDPLLASLQLGLEPDLVV